MSPKGASRTKIGATKFMLRTPAASSPKSPPSHRPLLPESCSPPSSPAQTQLHSCPDPNHLPPPPSAGELSPSIAPSRSQSSDTSPPASPPHPHSPASTPRETISSHFRPDTQNQTQTDLPPSNTAQPE